MPSFPKPKFPYTVNLAKEIKALRTYRDNEPGRQIPVAGDTNLRIATWNIANLGAQEREENHLKMMAEIISWFDVIAIQETKENITDLLAIFKLLPKTYRFILSDEGGNNERMVFLFNTKKVVLLEEIAELAIPPADFRYIKIEGVPEIFSGFDRSPYIVSFKAGSLNFTLLNVHLYFGSDSEAASINRRSLEAYAVGRWADLRSKSKHAFTPNALAMGDFNLPAVETTDPIYKALTDRGLQLPEHSTRVYSNISNDKEYDQIAFLPDMKNRVLGHGVFDYDSAVFKDLFLSKTPAEFRGYLKYYLSDHRPFWINLNVS